MQHLILKLLLHVHTAYCLFIYLCLCITHTSIREEWNTMFVFPKKKPSRCSSMLKSICYTCPPIILYVAQEIKIHCWRVAKSGFQNNNTTLCNHLFLSMLIVACLLIASFESGVNLVASCNNMFYIKAQAEETRTLISGLVYTSRHHVFSSLVFTKKHVLCISSVYSRHNHWTNQS